MKRKMSLIVLFFLVSLIITVFESEAQDIQQLAKQLGDENEKVRWSATEALAKIGEPAVPALIKALSHNNSRVRHSAAFALSRIGEPAKSAVPALIEALNDQQQWVRWNASYALGEIGEPAVRSLIKALSDENWKVRFNAAAALGWGSQVHFNVATTLSRIESSQVKKISVKIVPELIEALSDGGQEIRNDAVRALELIGTPEATRALEAHPSRIYGSIVDTTRMHNPIAEVKVNIASFDGKEYQTRTDDRGHYEVTGLAAGRYLINIYKDGYLDRRGEPVLLTGGNQYVAMEMEMKKSRKFSSKLFKSPRQDFAKNATGTIRGRIIEGNALTPELDLLQERAIPGVEVVISNIHGEKYQTTTDSGGNYKLSSIPPGRYLLGFHKTGHGSKIGKPVTVVAGKVHNEPLLEMGKKPASTHPEALAHMNRGQTYAEQGNLEEAAVEFKKAIRIDSSAARPHLALGLAYHQQDKLEEAVEAFLTANRLIPYNAVGHGMLANAYYEQGSFDQALAAYQKAIHHDPDYALGYHGLGRVYHKQENLNQAIAAYKKAIEIDSDLAEAHHDLGFIYEEQGNQHQAIAHLKEFVRLAQSQRKLQNMIPETQHTIQRLKNKQ